MMYKCTSAKCFWIYLFGECVRAGFTFVFFFFHFDSYSEMMIILWNLDLHEIECNILRTLIFTIWQNTIYHCEQITHSFRVAPKLRKCCAINALLSKRKTRKMTRRKQAIIYYFIDGEDERKVQRKNEIEITKETISFESNLRRR